MLVRQIFADELPLFLPQYKLRMLNPAVAEVSQYCEECGGQSKQFAKPLTSPNSGYVNI